MELEPRELSERKQVRVALPANDIEENDTLGNRIEKRAVAASAGSLPVNTECCTIQMTSQRKRRRREREYLFFPVLFFAVFRVSISI